MADFWHHFKKMQYPNKCRRCGTPLPVGASGWGTKDANNKWLFLCDRCHAAEEKMAVMVDQDEESETGIDWLDKVVMTKTDVNTPSVATEAGEPVKPKKTFLERLKDEAPWRFSEGVING